MTVAGYKSLVVYQRANELVLEIYRHTRIYPRDELFGLVSQMRRCAVSVAANIVEGYGRRTVREKLNFLYISRGSLTELEYYIDLSLQLRYIDSNQHKDLSDLRNEAGKLLAGYIRSKE